MQLSISRDVEEQCIAAIAHVFAAMNDVSSVPCATRIPTDSANVTLSEFVRIIASNPQSETRKTTAWTITVEGWAQTETRASRICVLALAALTQATGLLFDGHITGGAGNDPHPDYPLMGRYSATMTLRSRNIIQQINQ
jgi:hypothetical protein